MPNSLKFSNPDDFEKHIATLLKQRGYEIIIPPENTKGYDIELNKNGRRTAVQVKNHRAKCNVAQLQRFQYFLGLPIAERFHDGLFVSASGFSKPALTYIATQVPNKINLAEYASDDIEFIGETLPAQIGVTQAKETIKYIGVFTCKGGSGKTTTAAHLAGAFALMGYDVILLDLDPDKNLRKLFLQDEDDASLYVPPKRNGGVDATITALNHEDWDEAAYQDIKIVICDCSPVLSENPSDIIEKFDYCITPITLNPLGIAKNADVIIRTFEHIRGLNKKAEMFALINAYDTGRDIAKRNEIMLSHLNNKVKEYAIHDDKCKLIDPKDAVIRYSRALLYWGYHIIDGSTPQLAFNERGGISHPRDDFLRLVDYLENHTDIERLRLDGHI